MRHLGGPALLISLLPAVALAQVKAGPEFRVSTSGGQPGMPDVSATRSGDFVVVWRATSGSGSDVFGQRFDAVGAKRGVEFRVNTYTTGFQELPSVGLEDKQRFVVTWPSFNQDGDTWGVFGQRFGSGGAALGAEFQVNTYTTGSQNYVAVAAAGTSFLVVWSGTDAAGTGVFGRRYDWAGATSGAEFRVSVPPSGGQTQGITTMPDGGYVVVWQGAGIRGRRYDAAGAPVGNEFTISAAGGAQPRVVGRPDGSFVAAWTRGDIFARIVDAAGVPIGAELQVNTFTTGPQFWPRLATDDGGNFVVAWTSVADGSQYSVAARRYDAAGNPRGPEFQVNTYTTGYQYTSGIAADAVGNFVIAWGSYPQNGIFAQRFGGLQPAALTVDGAGNGVLDPGELATFAPSWRNVNGAAQTFGGSASTFTGPAGATYEILDATGAYGTVADGAMQLCVDCYQVRIQAAARPVQHWDASLLETIAPDAMGQAKTWRLHVGDSFTDVPRTSPFYRFIETLLHRGVTSGCGGAAYCPATTTTREQMAPFVLVAKEGPGYAPPACGTPVFSDVPASSPFCRFIEELARRGVVSGCGGGNYCPADAVTREQMAVFVLRTLDPALNPPACTTPVFADVPASSPFCRWIEELARRGVVTGCGGGNYCPTAAVTREQMSVFLTVTFGLTLYGP